MARRIDRRSFLKESGGVALGATAVTLLSPSRGGAAGESAFRSDWPRDAERPWAGGDYWTNPLEDWRIQKGRLECFSAGGDRNVFLLTREVDAREGTFTMSVRLGPLEDGAGEFDEGFAGFRTGIKSFVDDYRAREVRVAVWPRWVNPAESSAKPYAGWPITIRQLDNGLQGAEWTLKTIRTPGQQDPVLQVLKEPDEKIVYTLRIQGESFTPLVRESGRYTVIAFEPDGEYRREWKGLQAHEV